MVNYLDVIVADEIYKERVKKFSEEQNHYLYTPELPSLRECVSGFGKQLQSLLSWVANTIVTYQGHRAPIGRRLAAKRS